jgi:hypothetical protein
VQVAAVQILGQTAADAAVDERARVVVGANGRRSERDEHARGEHKVAKHRYLRQTTNEIRDQGKKKVQHGQPSTSLLHAIA